MSTQYIMAIKTNNRRKNVDTLQKVLTEFGCSIKMRLGLHEAGDICSDEGLILLQLASGSKDLSELERSLNDIEGIKAKLIEL